jgi:outer membrane protein W
MGHRSLAVPRVAALALALSTVAPAAHAQSQGDGYLFGAPKGSFTLRGSLMTVNSGGSVFQFARDQLTIDGGAFTGYGLGADVAWALGSRVDMLLSADFSGRRIGSEDRHYVDNNDQPIQQHTTFMRVPLTASFRAYLTPRGREIGNYAWIPEKIAPFIGAGGGMMYYSFKQSGDFVDYKTLDVFNDTFTSSRFTPTAHVLSGVDYSLTPRWAFTTQARYQWAKAKLSQDFQQFGRIDLSGLSATAGFYVRF